MLLSEGRNTDHEPFHWLVTSAVAMPGSVLHVWSAHPHSERNRSENYIWPEGRSGCQPESRLSAFAAQQGIQPMRPQLLWLFFLCMVGFSSFQTSHSILLWVSMKPAMTPPPALPLAGRDFVLGTSHTQIKPKWGGQAKKSAQGKTPCLSQPKIENHPIN